MNSPLAIVEHVALSVKDIKQTKKFYKELFVDFIGFEIVFDEENFFAISAGKDFLFEFWQEKEEFKNSKFSRYQVGLHHFGIKLESKEMVDKVYEKLVQMKVEILDKPAFYPEYMEGYYAVYYVDPNGFKMEFVSY